MLPWLEGRGRVGLGWPIEPESGRRPSQVSPSDGRRQTVRGSQPEDSPSTPVALWVGPWSTFRVGSDSGGSGFTHWGVAGSWWWLTFCRRLQCALEGDLRAKRKQAIGALKELKSRLSSTTALLVQHQADPIRQVTQGRDFALLSLLILLMSWGDTSYPMGLIAGLPAVGFAPHYNIFPLQPAQQISQLDVLEDWESHNASILRGLKPSRNDSFLLSQSQADADRGFCTYPLKRADMLALLKNQPHRLIPRCVITQSSGKQRIIDNADVGGQSLLSSDANKLVLCSPLRPAQHIAITHSYLSSEALSQAQASDAWESGGEDWPDAYRHSPMSRGESLGCVVY